MSLWVKFYGVTIQMKATVQYFPAVLFIMLYKMVLTFKSVDEILWQGLQILLISGVTVTSASQILESFWKIWSQVSQRKKPFADFTALGPGMNNYRDGYTV